MTTTTPSAPDEVVLDEKGLRAAALAIPADTPLGQMHRASEIAGNAIRAYLRASPQPAGVTAHGLHDDSEPVHAGLCRMMDDGGLPDDYRRIAAAAYARLPSPTDTRERVLEEAASLVAGFVRQALDEAQDRAKRGKASAHQWNFVAQTVSEVEAAIRALKSKPTEAPVEDGWIEWNGGECPIKRSDRVQVRFRTGDETTPLTGTNDFNWKHINEPGDIIAYRLAASTKEE